jgi:ferritin
MLSEKMTNALNDQIRYELYSGHLYLALAAFCDSRDMEGFANFFIVQEQEERFHAMKMYKYIVDQGSDVKIYGLDAPRTEFDSLEEVFEFSLEHEQSVTARFYELMILAKEENDFATQNFLQWFITEQVEEEASILAVLKKIKIVGGAGHGLLMLDNELMQRSFTPEGGIQ